MEEHLSDARKHRQRAVKPHRASGIRPNLPVVQGSSVERRTSQDQKDVLRAFLVSRCGH